MKSNERLLKIAEVKGWDYLSEFEQLSEDFIEQYQDKVW